MSLGWCRKLHGIGQSKGWCGSGNDTQAQNGLDLSRRSSQLTVRSPSQVLECQAAGSAECHVCAAPPVSGPAERAHRARTSSSSPRDNSQRS